MQQNRLHVDIRVGKRDKPYGRSFNVKHLKFSNILSKQRDISTTYNCINIRLQDVFIYLNALLHLSKGALGLIFENTVWYF